MLAGLPITTSTARLYFAVQALAGAVWWISVFSSDAVRLATLGDLPVLPVAVADVPLFVLASALVASGVRWAAWVAAGWATAVAAGMIVYATLTGTAGWGALLMTVAAGVSLAAGILVVRGRAPVEWIVTGPFAFRPAAAEGRARLTARVVRQMLLFWVLGFAFDVAGGLIHILLVIAAVIFLVNLISGRRAAV